jgi:enoyl-CoA hydratase/carnithine racemase
VSDPAYRTRFKTVDVTLDELGILTLRLHSRGESMRWTRLPHRELPELFAAIAGDLDVNVVIITGTGSAFIELDAAFEEGVAKGTASAAVMDEGAWEGVRLLENLLAIDVPIIAAVNGPVDVHAEIALLSDIVLCTEDTFFQDQAHVPSGLVPGDGVQIIFPMLLGPNRGRYFLLTGQKIWADEAKSLGLVGEVLSAEDLMPRAQAHAERLAAGNPVVMRNTRRVLVRALRQAIVNELQAGLGLEAVASLSGALWSGPHKPVPILDN